MKPKVYLETTICSYLTSRLSRNLVVAAHQQITQEWWDRRRRFFDLFVSELVLQEAGAGDASAAGKRLDALAEIPLLDMDSRVVALAETLVLDGVVPPGEPEDAIHLAVATVHGIDYLLTWNCAHIANAETWGPLRVVARQNGYEPPIICTPEELMGD